MRMVLDPDANVVALSGFTEMIGVRDGKWIQSRLWLHLGSDTRGMIHCLEL